MQYAAFQYICSHGLGKIRLGYGQCCASYFQTVIHRYYLLLLFKSNSLPYNITVSEL